MEPLGGMTASVAYIFVLTLKKNMLWISMELYFPKRGKGRFAHPGPPPLVGGFTPLNCNLLILKHIFDIHGT